MANDDNLLVGTLSRETHHCVLSIFANHCREFREPPTPYAAEYIDCTMITNTLVAFSRNDNMKVPLGTRMSCHCGINSASSELQGRGDGQAQLSQFCSDEKSLTLSYFYLSFRLLVN